MRNENELVYAMHENSVMRMLGYVMGFFADGGSPEPPWSLYINFNKKHEKIKLGPQHFTADGENVTKDLVERVAAIDPGWRVSGSEPVFEEVATRKCLKLSERGHGELDLKKMLENINKPREVTFFSVMRQVFGKR